MSDDDTVWEQTLDDGRYMLIVTRIDEDHGHLRVIANNTNHDVLHEDIVPLNYGARFGPDVDDVAEWQEMTIQMVDTLGPKLQDQPQPMETPE